jgi:hypothetical protein
VIVEDQKANPVHFAGFAGMREVPAELDSYGWQTVQRKHFPGLVGEPAALHPQRRQPHPYPFLPVRHLLVQINGIGTVRKDDSRFRLARNRPPVHDLGLAPKK